MYKQKVLRQIISLLKSIKVKDLTKELKQKITVTKLGQLREPHHYLSKHLQQ